MSDKVAFLYPGQGAQVPGMGRDFYQQYPKARRLFDAANDALDFNLMDVCFSKNDRLDQTAFTQPALVAVSLAITEVAGDMGLIPEMTAGLSLGEYSAIAAAGGMEPLDAIRLVRKRGCFMEEAAHKRHGVMAAVLGLSKEQVSESLSGMDGVWAANYNCPGQIVITGVDASVEKACVKLREAGAKRTVRLNVSGAFHSPVMMSAAKQLEQELDSLVIEPLNIPYYTNVTGEKVTDEKQVKALLASQITHSVMWEQTIRNMRDDGATIFVEVGPGKTLSNFVKRIDRNSRIYQIGTVEQMEQVIGEIICRKER